MDPKIFEEHREHLRGVARRMLGSTADADDAVQEAWLRANAADTSDVDNFGGWLTTIVARVCLNMLRSRSRRPVDHLDDPIVLFETPGPDEEAALADSVGLALQVVLDTLSPGERLAFVLHDMFAVPFDEIAEIVGRTPDAARQLASRARRRVQGADQERVPAPKREVVDAFFAAARSGDFDSLVAVLDPDVVLANDRLPAPLVGADAVARSALMFADPARLLVAAIVNGNPGVVVTLEGQPVAVMGFAVAGDRITAIEAFNEPDLVARIVPFVP